MWWHDKCAFQRPDRVVVKLRDESGAFLKSVIVPTIMYPLNGKCEVFTFRNTKKVEDEAVLACFDSVQYKIGRCYDNVERMTKALKDAGYNAVSYVGWLFTSNNQFPIHHCWTVLDGHSVIDLCDDFSVMLGGKNGELFKNAKGPVLRGLIASFTSAARKEKNSARCFPVGTPTPFLYYVGSPCEPEKGREMYCRLVSDFPGHECERNCDASGMNAMQRVLAQYGLMD